MSITDDPLATIDAKELEADIDRAIDELFVQQLEHKEEKEPPAPAAKPAQPPPPEAKPATAAPQPKAKVDRLAALKESLLSLDWEITPENIDAFEREVIAIGDDFAADRHVQAVVKMTAGVCKYLRAMKSSADAISMQFCHAATRSLDLLTREPAISDAERRQIMDKLLSKFRRVKADAQRLKPPSVRPQPAAAEPAKAATPAAVEAAEEPAEAEPQLQPEPAAEAALEPELAPEEEAAVEEVRELEIEPEAPAEPTPEVALEPETEPEVELAPEVEPEPVAEFPEAPAPEVAAQVEPQVERVPPQAAEIGAPEVSSRAAAAQARGLIEVLAGLRRDTEDFFAKILKSLEGKPALAKIAAHFSRVRQTQLERIQAALNEAEKLAEALEATAPGMAAAGPPPPSGLEQMQQSLKEIHQAVQRLEKAVAPAAARSTTTVAEAAPEPAAATTDTVEADLLEDLLELDEEAAAAPPPAAASIYLANIMEHTLGIPTEAVAAAYKVSGRKAKSLRRRGYVTLVDFKAPFRSVKKGLTGPLAEEPVKKLKKMQFPLIKLSPEVLGPDASPEAQKVNGVILFAHGDKRGALFTDDVLELRPYEVRNFRQAGLPGEVSGTAAIEGDFEINVLNVDHLLS